ncbi:hypothetical protein [Brachybacterium sp.]|uniref:hypothetical protein n=1 Tax=Brachybacterium sp. TaxID=1891286 RepID=UPI002ED590AA
MNRSAAQQAATRAAQASNRARTDARIDELEFLVEGGEALESAIARLGWTASAAARALFRRQHRYAREAERIAWARRAE